MKRVVKLPVILSVILLLALSALLAGCSSSTGGKSGGKVELNWLVRTDPNMIKWEQSTIKSFEKKYPNITVKLTRIPQSEIDQRLSTMIASGNVPDVWSANWANSGFATYYKMGALLDLTPYIEKDPAAVKGIPSNILNIYKMKGKTYGLPMLSIGSFVFYNKDLFDKAGLKYPTVNWDDKSWNWNTMEADAAKLTKLTGKPKTSVWGVVDGRSVQLTAWNFGGDFFKQSAYQTSNMGTPTVDTNPNNLKAVQARVDLIKKGYSPNQTALNAVSQLGDPFMTGRVAMTITGGWGFWSYKGANFKWGVAPIPYANNFDGARSPQYTDPWNISAKSKHPEQAWTFLKYLISPTGAGKTFMEATSATPANAKLMPEWEKQMSQITGMSVSDVKTVSDGAIKYGREADNHLIDKFANISTSINQTMTDVFNSKKSPADGLKEIQKNLETLGNQN